MIDSTSLNEISDSQTAFLKNVKDEKITFIKKNLHIPISESQDFHLIDSSNTEDYFAQDNIQNNSEQMSLKKNKIEIEDIKQNLKNNELLTYNINNQTCINSKHKTKNSLLKIEENIKSHDEKSLKKYNTEKKLMGGDIHQNTIIIDDKSYQVHNKECLKRKASESNDDIPKHFKVSKNDSLNIDMCTSKDITKIHNSNMILKTRKIDLIDKVLQPELSIYSKQIKNLDSKINDDIRIINNKLEKKKSKLYLDCNSMMNDNDETNLMKVYKSDQESICPVDGLTSVQGNINSNFAKITSTSNLEDIHNIKGIENLYNAFLNKEVNSCSVQKALKSRMSIEVIYDKTTPKVTSKELVEITENGEEIILDFSQEEVNLNVLNKVNINNIKTNCKNDMNSFKNFKGSVSNILKPSLYIQNEKKDFTDTVSAINYNDKLVEYLNQQTDIQIGSEQSNSIPTLLKKANSMVVTISDSDNSLIDDCAKNKCLNNAKLNHENIKITQIEKEINFNVKIKCLLSFDENTKEIYQKEIMNVSCEQNSTNPLMHQKVADSSTSTACLADISASDNKDSSPASVNSIPQLYNLQPSRLSFVSTVSSSSSASCAVSLSARKFSKDTQFSYPQWPAKHVKKHVNELNPEDKQNWDTFEKLTKDWKNSHIIISTITNFLNNEIFIFDCDNGTSDLLENSQIFRSSTPELEAKKKSSKRSSVRNSKKAKFTKQLRNSNIIDTDNESHNLFATPIIPIKELKAIIHSSSTSTSEMDNEFLNKEVFAKWSDNNYYPGKVSDVVGMKYKVKFFDGKTKLLLPDFILPIKENLEMRFSAYAFINEDRYASSVMIVDIEKRDNKVIYVVETDKGKKVKTMISNIFLTSDQAKLLREQIVKDPTITSIPQQLSYITLDNVLSNKRRSKKVITSAIHKSKLKKCSFNKINKSNDLLMPSVSGMQNRLQEKLNGSIEEKITSNDKEDKQLLGVQNEIIGTLNEQIIKRPLNKIKGKIRNRKKLESLQDFEILGPIPESNSNIFKGMTFILSCVSPETLIRYQIVDENNDSNSEPGTENEEEWIKYPFVRDHLQTQIIVGGGKIYDNFEDIPPEEYSITKHITNVPNLTKKSLLCLSVGIRSYNHQWVIRSCQQNKVIQPAEEELPAGWSLEKEVYIDTYQRPKNKPLEHTIVAIPLLKFEEAFVKFWKKICQNAGASVRILENPVESFMEATIVLANKNCPLWVITQANNWHIPVLSTTWVIQCLVEGKLCSSDAKKEYKYSVTNS